MRYVRSQAGQAQTQAVSSLRDGLLAETSHTGYGATRAGTRSCRTEPAIASGIAAPSTPAGRGAVEAAVKRAHHRGEVTAGGTPKRRVAVPMDRAPIFVTPRYARYLNAQRERLKAEALARWGKSSDTTDAADR